MGYPIRPSNVRVYQFHHDGKSSQPETIRYFPEGFAGAGAAGAGR